MSPHAALARYAAPLILGLGALFNAAAQSDEARVSDAYVQAMTGRQQNPANVIQLPELVDYPKFLAMAREGKITRIKVLKGGNEIVGTGPGLIQRSFMNGRNIEDDVTRMGLETPVSYPPPVLKEGGESFLDRYGVPIGIAIASLAFIYWLSERNNKRQLGEQGKASTFGKSKARLMSEANNTTTFSDVAGCDEAKEEVGELVDFLKDPKKFQRLGGRIPRGVLMVGPPGSGKTLLAKAIAGEAKVPFFSVSGSDFVEMYVGVGAARVRDMFEQAKKSAPCIIFIDEIDAMGKHRSNGPGGNDEREQTLNQMLVEMDGFETNLGVIVMAATNRPDILDPALMRPGRFDRQVYVTLPDIRGREQILKVHMRKVPLDPGVQAGVIARGTPGFSGADLMNLVNEAALFAARRGGNVVEMRDFEKAKDKIMMGPERKSMLIPQEELENTAYHEFSHALVTIHTGGNPVHKVTIIPRGRALGMMVDLPDRDQYSINKKQMLSRIAALHGGRLGEKILHGDDMLVTTGASNDIERATQMARDMVMRYGYSDKLGVLFYGRDERTGLAADLSESTRGDIDKAVRDIIDGQIKIALGILKDKEAVLHEGAARLLEFETLSGEDILDILKGVDIGPRKREERQAQVIEHLKDAKARIGNIPPANDDQVRLTASTMGREAGPS